MTTHKAIQLACFCLVAAGVREARAEPAPGAPLLGDSPWGLPGLVRVGVPGAGAHGAAVAASAGYGLTESIGVQEGANHRAAGVLALGVIPASWLELALRFDGRYDVHPSDERGGDDGAVGDPRLAVRIGRRFGHLHAGVELDAWFPGADAPSFVAEATTLDARGLFGWRADSGLVIAGLAGFRLDQSGAAEERPEELRVGDRVALGLSDSHAVLAGLGFAQPFGALELVGEVSADLLLGPEAPPIAESPLRLTLGGRYRFNRRLQASAWVDAGLSGRPAVGSGEPLVPIEPRLAAMLGLSYRFLGKDSAAAQAEPMPPPPAPVAPVPPTTAPPTEPPKAHLTGRVRDESGQPVPDARVWVVAGDRTYELRTAAEGQFDVELPAGGEAQVTVSAEGFDPGQGKVVLEPDQPKPLEITMVPAVPAGQLKGLVRSFDGKGMRATVRIAKIGVEVQADDAGAFELNLPPGTYEVEIEAAGYTGQKRTVKIDNRGVTVLNADLRARP